jgi:hypothetical protein
MMRGGGGTAAGYPGMQQPPGRGGGGLAGGGLADEGGGGAPGGPGGQAGIAGGPGGEKKGPDYSSATEGARSFLEALQNKDIRLVAEATALRAEYEAESARDQAMFRDLKSESLAQEDFDELARAFDGMKVVGMNQRKSTASVGVIVGKQEENAYMTRTLLMRKEKDGWKVMDYGRLRVQKTPNLNRKKQGGGGSNGR